MALFKQFNVKDLLVIQRKLIFLFDMNHTFDFDDIFADFNLSFPTPQSAEDKNCSHSIPTYTDCSPDILLEDGVQHESILQISEPQEINHYWISQQNPHEYQDFEKSLLHSRKDTAVFEQVSHPIHSKEEKRRRRFNLTQKNETKNIPKNYGKAILAFIQKEKKLVKQVLQKNKAGRMGDFIEFMDKFKKQITTIADLRQLWVDNPYQSVIRTLSCIFLRRYSLGYIFNSRVCNYVSHIKYRQRFLEAIKAPKEFKHIKDF